MTTPYYRDEQITLLLGDALDQLRTFPDASVDAVITDPPYEIGVAGQAWDSTGIAYSTPMWAECLRVLKPGGHLLSFGAPRTYHRMVVAAEDAGFRVIDQLDWIYTHGKPKGVDLARAIDRRRDDRIDTLKVTEWLAAQAAATGWTRARLNGLFGFHERGQATHWITQGVAARVPTSEQWARLRGALGFDDTEILPLVTGLNARKHTVGAAFDQREIISEQRDAARDTGLYRGYSGHRIKSRAHSDEARRWEGWNTQLKPAHDPILLARKTTGYDSLVGGLLRHGVGGLNVAGCPASGGGYPTNILLGHDCPPGGCLPGCPVRETGDAARSFPVFRLESRTPNRERVEVDGVRHDTPKPLALMRYLVRLVTPPAGTVLDPFAGSSTTLLAARDEGMHAIGIEQHEPYARLSAARLSEPYSVGLFDAAS
ncbi:DNA-methyltransferase [Streptomyces sp. DT117]|uniref:DNA-methyltransferase n=1 Tax=Streptomyces sp. DT117 TaxID=3393422 RepID=UPI003CED8805